MAIYSPERFKQARPANFDGIFEWDFLIPAFHPTRIQPMDWDGVVERRGHFLVYETKEPGKDVPLGQKITLETAVLTGHMTVFLIQGKTQATIRGLEIWTPNNSNKAINRYNFTPCTAETVVEKTRLWFEYANRNPHPNIKRIAAGVHA